MTGVSVSQIPASASFSLWLSFGPAMKAPDSTTGVLTKITGHVPSTMDKRLSLKIPQSTLVGQSGPPTKTDTLDKGMPGFSRIICTALMNTLSTPTCCWILTYFPRPNPIMYWPQHASSFKMKLKTTAARVPPTKPMSIERARAASTTPELMYTGRPGTGGSINMMNPMIKKMTQTITNSTFKSSSLSQERKTEVSFATPIESVQYNKHNQFTLIKILAQFHILKFTKTNSMPSVNLEALFVAPRILRTLWFIMLTTKPTGINIFKPMTMTALAQSLVAKLINPCIKREPRAPTVMARAPTSKYTHTKSKTRPAAQKAKSVPVRRIDAPAMEIPTYIVSKRNMTNMMNCFNVFSSLEASVALR
mmetsp:Transcript_67480/g.106827  ORF Transcript_67480/g.106827 Transcript_67480/m.106827 type:complete len:363 (-) Transcript_67480:1587-2675(-)